MSNDDLAQTDFQALAEIRFRIRQFLRFSEDAARAAGIEPQQHQALLALVGLPAGCPASVGALAERLQIRHHSAVELVDRLVQSELVQRSRDSADRRQVLLSLTPKGLSIVQQLSLSHRAELQTVGPALLEALSSLLADRDMSHDSADQLSQEEQDEA